ncbi:MAG TPA: diguanylate cyclase [Burkholderiales bacterium]|nr:diguanylate cyclase [Burkholderiales bacterium]
MIPSPRFDELKTTGKLPSPAGVALAVIDLCRQDNVSVDSISRAVCADPALSGRIIKFANSAANGARRPIVSVPDAIRMVGISTVRQLVLGFSLLGQYRTGACKVFDYQRFWSRSLGMAISATALARRIRSAPPDEIFTCGLLAGIGRLAIATLYPEAWDKLLSTYAGVTSDEFLLREREQFSTDHNELGAALLEDWHLPKLFVSAVFHHETVDESILAEGSREALLASILRLAAELADLYVARDEDRPGLLPDVVLAAAKLGVDEAALSALTDETVKAWKDWGKLLEVKTQDVPAFDQMMQAAVEPAKPLPTIPIQATGIDPLTILAVDDDRSTLLVLEHLLKGLGHTVLTAQDGKSALAKAVSSRPQIIISDWIMPGMDGMALCKALRQTEEGRHMYFIVLSALEQDDQLVEAFESGVDDYLTKPFTPKVLAARLRAGLRVIHLQEEAQRDNENMRRFAAELAVANRRLQQAALTDSLTGLPNRRYGMERLEQEWAASQRGQRPLACMIIDLDLFKQVNDNHGHDIGDMLLRQVANVLRKEIRAEDVICRMGGEEFLVISTDTGLVPAVHLAERLRLAAAKAPLRAGSSTFHVTISVGVAQREPSMQRIDELLKVADNALYAAKAAGRNRVVAHRESTPKATAVPIER